MTYLLDGYNLMHAVGLATKAMPAKAFERSRERFLDWLADAIADRTDPVRAIFDAAFASRPSNPYSHGRVEVVFARGQTADDHIAELVAVERLPETLAVVSNDSSVREGARRRGCRVFACSEFVDWLIAVRRSDAHPQPEPEKPATTATPDEMAAWLEAFSAPKKRTQP